MNISRTASAFLKGVYFVREHAMAQDAKDTPEGTRWVTIGHTEEHKGQHVLISKKDGRIEGGLGGKFNGTKLKDLGKTEKAGNSGVFGREKEIRRHSPDRLFLPWQFRYVLQNSGCLRLGFLPGTVQLSG